MKYIVKFQPKNEWGCISKSACNKEEAYKIYHEIKNLIDDIRPGNIFILEIDNDGKEKYLCKCQTGKKIDGQNLIEEINNLTNQLRQMYDIEYLENKLIEYSKMETDMIHVIEVIDFSQFKNPEKVYEELLDRQKMITSIRRQYKQNLKDAKSMQKSLNTLRLQVLNIKNDLNQNGNYKIQNDIKKEEEKYFKNTGIDLNKFLKEEQL